MRIKFFWAVVLAATVYGFVQAVDYETTKSTNATSASTLSVIPLTDPGDILGSLLINSRTASSETIKIYDSSGTTNNLIGTIALSTGGITSNEYVYNLRISSAVTITKSGATADTTIIWKNVR